MSLKNKLNRMKNHLSSEQNPKTAKEKSPSLSFKENIPNIVEWEEYGAKAFYFNEEYCLIREVHYSLDYQHGKYQLKELLPIVEKWQNSTVEHPLSAKGHKSTDLFFFDTETTGLSGGVGTTIFLLGYARVLNDKVIVKQHLLPGPGNEVALYQSFLQEVDYTTLVTYNGKAFDWPQVKTRHTLIREHVPKLPSFGHFDLLHASRRLWKDDLESVRLSNVEKKILNITRHGDIPGFLAPMIYFDFVKNRELEGIKGVLKHNESDVLTLITLYIHLSKLLQVDGDSRNQKEQYEIGRWFDALGQKGAAATLYENIVDTSWRASFNLGILKKKEKKFQQAQKLFLQAFNHEENTCKELAGIELAKLLEHQQKDYSLALHYAEKSWECWQERQPSNGDGQAGKERDFLTRINRLKRKIFQGK